MLTGEIRSQIDSIWNDFWSGGVSNPLSVIEQITYLLFIKRLDELHTVEEAYPVVPGRPICGIVASSARQSRRVQGGRPWRGHEL